MFEKFIKVRIVNVVNNYSLCQLDAFLEVDNFTQKNIDIYYKVLGIFQDIQKAFDSVNHAILLYKLDQLGIRGIPNNF